MIPALPNCIATSYKHAKAVESRAWVSLPSTVRGNPAAEVSVADEVFRWQRTVAVSYALIIARSAA